MGVDDPAPRLLYCFDTEDDGKTVTAPRLLKRVELKDIEVDELIVGVSDDTTRLAYVEILDDEKGPTCVSFLRRAIGFFAAHGITVERVMTDNGTGYRSKAHRAATAQLGIRHLRTQPYRPRTNGKAERFIQTLQREWAYAIAYESSWRRRQALTPWLRYYNCRRPHSALGHKTPISQLR